MNKLLITGVALAALIGTPALAADMRLKAPPPPPWNWNGFYVGLNAGYSVADDPFNQTLVSAGTVASSSINSRATPNGGLFGGQAGYNYQTGNIVFGVEGDLQWSGEHDTAGCGLQCLSGGGIGVATLGSVEQRIKWFGTARGRIGWTNNDWLLYITGGAAWSGIDATTAVNIMGIGVGGAFSNTTSFTKSGAVIGGGTEVHLGGQWTAKVEYLYMDLGGISDTLVITGLGVGVGGTATLTTNSKIHDNIIRAGLNFKIN